MLLAKSSTVEHENWTAPGGVLDLRFRTDIQSGIALRLPTHSKLVFQQPV
jgi:hypothetical protein